MELFRTRGEYLIFFVSQSQYTVSIGSEQTELKLTNVSETSYPTKSMYLKYIYSSFEDSYRLLVFSSIFPISMK